MKINFKGTNLELSNKIRAHVEEKLTTIAKLLADGNGGSDFLAEVELGRTTDHHKHGEVFRAEVNLRVAGQYFRSEATTPDLYASIDEVKDELLREVKTWKKKQGTLFRRGARRIKNLFRGQ